MLIIQIQVHARIIHQCGLVQVDVNAIVGLEQERRLHARLAELLLRQVGSNAALGDAPNLAQPRTCVLIFLRVIVTANPPRQDVTRHGKLRLLLLDHKIGEIIL